MLYAKENNYYQENKKDFFLSRNLAEKNAKLIFFEKLLFVKRKTIITKENKKDPFFKKPSTKEGRKL